MRVLCAQGSPIPSTPALPLENKRLPWLFSNLYPLSAEPTHYQSGPSPAPKLLYNRLIKFKQEMEPGHFYYFLFEDTGRIAQYQIPLESGQNYRPNFPAES